MTLDTTTLIEVVGLTLTFIGLLWGMGRWVGQINSRLDSDDTLRKDVSEIKVALIGIDGKNGLRGEMRGTQADVEALKGDVDRIKAHIGGNIS